MLAALPTAVRTLLLANGVAFIAEGFLGDPLTRGFALWPLDSGAMEAPAFQVWQLLTYGFLHAGLLHLLVNMYALAMFGSDLERLWGRARFINLYLASVVTAGITQLLFYKVAGLAPFPTVGASGGVFGLLLAYALYFPRRTVTLLIPPVPMPAWLFATLYALLELGLGVTGTQEGVAHFAHLGGMLGAGVMIWNWRRRPR